MQLICECGGWFILDRSVEEAAGEVGRDVDMELEMELVGLRKNMKREVGAMKKEEDEMAVFQTETLKWCCLHNASGRRPSKELPYTEKHFFLPSV